MNERADADAQREQIHAVLVAARGRARSEHRQVAEAAAEHALRDLDALYSVASAATTATSEEAALLLRDCLGYFEQYDLERTDGKTSPIRTRLESVLRSLGPEAASAAQATA